MAGEPPSKRVKTTPSSTAATMAATVKQMDGSQGFDAVVVCTSNAAQEAWWQVPPDRHAPRTLNPQLQTLTTRRSIRNPRPQP
jgi:hypothetical protein